jgi:parallel beta-helix repeat protein
MHRKLVMVTFLVIVLVGVLDVTQELQVAYASPYTDIDVDTAYDMITNGSYPDLVVLDVRTKSEYDGGHIYGAVWMPHSELEARIDELAGYEDHEIIAYCLSGGRSAAASNILELYNFTRVYNMLGGISAWQSRGYPVWIATVHNVNTTFNYDTIQAAIASPQTLDGHTIFVDEGTYYEHVVLNKSLSLIGENRSTTIIDGNYAGNVIKIIANNVKITGFTVQNSYSSHPYCGIYIGEWTAGNSISYNCITDNFYGVGLWNFSNNNSVYQNKITRNNFGVSLNMSSNNIVSGNNITKNLRGFLIKSCSDNNILCGNKITFNDFGVLLFCSSKNSVSGNQIVNNNYDGIQLSSAFNNTFSGNEITANDHNGIRLDSSCNNRFYHNNLDNTQQLRIDLPSFANFWDDGVEGNYWSDYDVADADYDGIGDSWYEIDENNTDHHPLMGIFSSFNTSRGNIYTVCNSAISDFQCYFDTENQTNVIKFNVNGTEGTGFCRICIPHTILNETYTILVDGNKPDYVNYALYDNGTHHWIYFTYQHSTHEVIIIPEFSSVVILPLFLMATLVTAIVYRRLKYSYKKASYCKMCQRL